MRKIDKGGICAPIGFVANGIHCGIRKNQKKKDLSLIYSLKKAVAACVYTTNKVKGAPLIVTKKHLQDGYAQAIICNSGNANTCNENGIQIANQMCSLLSENLSVNENDVIVASTGVIGQPMDITPIQEGIPHLVSGLGKNSISAAEGIMTTDTIVKEVAFRFKIGEKTCHIGGIAKGSGMIHPNMATMLVFITTDTAIAHDMLQHALSNDVEDSFNMISVDGDTSTNDMVAVMANGMAGNKTIDEFGEDFDIFRNALSKVTKTLCKMIASDGEGATKLLICNVKKAVDLEDAKIIAKSVISSSLVKAAMFGADANWGRILCAIGYSEAKAPVMDKIDVSFKSAAGSVLVCSNSQGVDFSEEEAKKILSEKEIEINISMNSGIGSATAWGCDLTYDYVRINGDYRT